MSYTRVIPRDLFNDANLLKCAGRLCLLIENRMIPWMSYEHDGQPFDIVQNESDGSTYIANLQFFIDGKPVAHSRPLNSREPYPLWVSDSEVFDDSGEFILANGGDSMTTKR